MTPIISNVIVLGSINTDLVIRGQRLPRPGETVLGGEFLQSRGGKGANQAVAAARGAECGVCFLGAVGDDEFGRTALDSLSAEGIDRRFVKTAPGMASGVALILVDRQGENCISVASGANLALSAESVDAVPAEIFARAKVFLACLESPLLAVRRGLERAKAAGLTTILNPAPAIEGLLTSGVLELVDVLIPNAGEAAALAGMQQSAEVEPLARRLQELGAGSVIVTCGGDGSLVLDPHGVVTHLPAASVTAIDTTAAGDAFCGALAAALATGQPLLCAAQWATTAAAISVTRAGAQPSLPTRKEIEEFAQQASQ